MPMRYRTALVTGGAGFIGSHIVGLLLDRGIEPVVLDDLSVGRKENVPAGVRLVQADVCDVSTMDGLAAEVDAVFHLAARVSIRGSVDDFIADANTNVMGTLNVVRSVMRSKRRPKLVFASSMAVYGNARRLPIGESHPLEPGSPYGIGKLAAESYCLGLSKLRGFKAVVLRYFNTFGPRQTVSPYVGVITIFADRLLRGHAPVIFGDGEQIRDFVSVHDVAEASVRAMEADIDGTAVNVGSGSGTSVNRIAGLLIEKTGSKLKPCYEPARPEEPANSVADVTCCERLLGFRAGPTNRRRDRRGIGVAPGGRSDGIAARRGQSRTA